MDETYDRIELACFLSEIYQALGIEQGMKEKMIGEGLKGRIWKISDQLCIKISKNKSCPEFPQSIKDCYSLCVPIKTYYSNTNMYTGYVLKFLNSTCLQSIIIDKYKLSEKDIAIFLYDILQGLAKLHENRYVHRDFHPGNIMLHEESGIAHAVIVDFDDTQIANEETRPLFRFSGYHAPEVVFRDERYDDRSEVFAVGVMMWELLFGECPFGGYDYFGRIVASSWNDYEINKEYFHQKVTVALQRLNHFLNQIEGTSSICAELLRRLLAENRYDRISAAEALHHPFFSGINNSHGGQVK